MSSVSGVSQGLYQSYQGIAASNATAQTTSTTSASDAQAATEQQGTGRVHHGHHRHGGGGQMFQQIEQAVTSALDSAKSSGSTDPNQAIQDALTKVFQNSGKDAAPSASSTQQAGSSTASTDPQQFFQMLKENGIDPKQFQQDLHAAMLQARGGTVNPSQAFASFPPGMAIDTQA